MVIERVVREWNLFSCLIGLWVGSDGVFDTSDTPRTRLDQIIQRQQQTRLRHPDQRQRHIPPLPLIQMNHHPRKQRLQILIRHFKRTRTILYPPKPSTARLNTFHSRTEEDPVFVAFVRKVHGALETLTDLAYEAKQHLYTPLHNFLCVEVEGDGTHLVREEIDSDRAGSPSAMTPPEFGTKELAGGL